MRKLWLVFVICSWGCLARADSVQIVSTQTVTQEIKQGSSLVLKQGVAQEWAANLLDAQSLASYASATSLELSINAVLKAISLEGSIAGFTWCGTVNCIWVNQQSLIAIDPNAGVGITPNALVFSTSVSSTLEPNSLILLGLGLLVLIVRFSLK